MQLDEVDVLLPGKDKRIMMFHDVYGLVAIEEQYIIYPKVPGRVFLYCMLEYYWVYLQPELWSWWELAQIAQVNACACFIAGQDWGHQDRRAQEGGHKMNSKHLKHLLPSLALNDFNPRICKDFAWCLEFVVLQQLNNLFLLKSQSWFVVIFLWKFDGIWLSAICWRWTKNNSVVRQWRMF